MNSLRRFAAPAWLLLLVAACGQGRAPSAPPSPAEGPAAKPATVAKSAADTSDDPAVAKAAQEYLDLLCEISPESATSLGLHARDMELDARTPEAYEADLAREEAMLAALQRRFEHPKLSAAGRTDLSILLGTLTADVRTKRAIKPLERQPDLYASPMQALFFMSARNYAPAAERAERALARIEKIPAILDAAKANLKSPPRVWTLVGIDRAKGAASFFDEQRPFLESALPNEKPRIDKALKGAKGAYAAYATFLEKDLLPRSNGDFAAGRELFELLLRESYFLDRNADQILEMGRTIFARTNAEMEVVAKRIDPKAKGWPEVATRLKANHPTAQDLLPSYRREVERARKFLIAKDVVPFPDGDDCQVIDTPPFLRTTITAAYDQPPPFDSTTQGFFFITPVNPSLPAAAQEEMLRENDHGDLVDTSVHEAYPGHHLQLSFARRHPSLIRKATGPSIFAEGWALYSEELMAELGYYTDEERLLQLEWTLVRAARVIIDVGLHTKGMTFDEAVKVLTDQVHLEHELAVSEVKRYTLEPTQPLAYLTGREMIFRLRERYKAREGAAFTLKKFHTDLLSRGTVAPGLLEQEMFGD